MDTNKFLSRIIASILALILLFNEGTIFAAYAAETNSHDSHESCTDCEESDRIDLTNEDITQILDGTSELDVTFSPEAEAALTQTMEVLSQLLESGQVQYNEETGMFALMDPNADLSGLNITGLETATDANGTERLIANLGMSTDNTTGELVFFTDSTAETESEDPAVDEEVIAEELPTEEDSSDEETSSEEPPVETEPSDEALPEETDPNPEDAAEETPAEEEPVDEAPVEGAPVEEQPVDEAPAEEESTDEEVSTDDLTEEEISSEDLAEDEEVLDADAELMFFSDCKHKATKSANVKYYNTYKSGRKTKGTIAKKGTIVNVVDSKWCDFKLYYKVNISGVGTYWVLSDNLKSHECSASSVSKTTKYEQISGNNSKHYKIVTTPAKICSKCNCTISKKDVDKSKQDHNWNSVGVCKDCGYNFKEEKDNCTDWVYLVIKDGVKLRSDPYSGSTSTRTLNAGDSVVVTHKVKNAFHSLLDPHIWYLTDKGDYIYSENAEIHFHSYNDTSRKTGRCTVCNRLYKYDIIPMSNTAYEVAVNYNVPIRKYPYSQSDMVAATDANTIYTVTGYTYPDPKALYWDKGDKWYRLDGLGWVKYSDIKEHVNHKYTESSGGTCCYTGCTAEFELKTKKIDKTAYETKSAGVVGYKSPYTASATSQTYQYKSTIVTINRKVTNSLGETWLCTTDGVWIKSANLKVHSHTLNVGVCTATGCSYISKQNTKTCKKYTGEITTTTNLMEKPFDDAKTIRKLLPYTCLTINGTCTVEGKVWYRTTEGYFIDSACIKTHAHNYQGGYCSPCGSYASWTETVINPIVVKAKADNTVVREKPYAVSTPVRYLSKNDELVIVQKCTNSLKKTWYQLADGSWIYSENVKTTSGAKVTTSSKHTIDNYTITLEDDCGDPIVGATVEWVGQTYTSDEKGKVTLAYVTTKTDLTIKCTGYDTITLTDYTMSTSRKETQIMALSGSYKASEVIMDYLGSQINLLRTSKNLNKYHTQGFFQADFTITCKMSEGMAEKVSKYELVQGTDVIAKCTDGTFTGLDVGDFYDHKTVYLKVYNKAGKECAKQELRLNIFNETLSGSTPNLSLGLGDLKIGIPAGCPLIGGIEISIDPPSIVDVSVEIDDDSTKGSVEIDVGSIGDTKDQPKYDADKTYWTNIGGYKKYWDTIKEMRQNGWESYFNRKQIKAADTKLKWDFALGGYIEKMHGEDTWNGKIYFCVSAKISQGWQFMTPIGVPLVAEISFKGQGTIGAAITIQQAQVTNFTVPLDLSFTIEASLGIGLKHIAEVSLFGQASLGLEFQLYPPEWDETNIFLRASLGIKAKALGAELYRLTFLESPIVYIVQEGQFVLFEEDDAYAALMSAENYTPIRRDYLADRTGWYESGAELMDDVSVSISDMDVEVIQSSTYTDLKPQVVSADDGTIMMLFTDDNASREAIDRTMLVFSLYNPATGQWTEPKPVYDDGTGDYGFSAHNIGDDIYLVWQNAKSTHAADADITAVSRNLEVTVAKYDAVAGEFVCIEQLTDNDVYENMPRISAVNGQVVVSWLTNSDHSVFQASGVNTVWYAVKTEAEYDSRESYTDADTFEQDFSSTTDDEQEVPVEEESDESYEDPAPTPWVVHSVEPTSETITSMAVGYMLNSGYVAYTTDEDGNTNTVEDQYIRLIDVTTGEWMAYTDKACNVEFTRVHGDNAMTWYNEGTIYYALDPNYAPMMLLDEEIVGDANLGNDYQIISDDQGNMAILSTRNGESNSNAYIMLYDDTNYQWGLPVAVTDQDLYIKDFYGAYHEGTIVSIFNRTAIDETTFEDTNTLCSAIINERTDLSVSNVDVYTHRLEPLTTTPVLITITNNGTSRVESFDINLYDELGNLLSTQTVNQALRMGQSTTVDVFVTTGETIEQTNYLIEVVPTGLEDDHPQNNEHTFEVGSPYLRLDAESTPTSTENIVVLTVTNIGYGELGGKLVLLDDNGAVAEVLIEEFAPVEHDGEYSCALLFGEDYFGDASYTILHFGLIPSNSIMVEFDTYLYVAKATPADDPILSIEDTSLDTSEEDASLMEATEKYVSGFVFNDTEFDLTNVLLCASAYDFNGVWLDCYTESIPLLSAEESYYFNAVFSTEEDIESVTVMLLDSETLQPLITAEEITIIYDVISN